MSERAVFGSLPSLSGPSPVYSYLVLERGDKLSILGEERKDKTQSPQ